MTKEAMAVLPEIIGQTRQMQAPPIAQPTAPAGAPPPSAPSPAPAGVSPAPLPMQAMAQMPTKGERKDPETGEFPIKIIAAIQQIYASEVMKQERLQGNLAQNLSLQPGWGGQ